MNKIPYFNDSDRFVHIGAVTIPPRETRDVDERLLPGFKAPQSDAQSSEDPLLVIAALSVAKLEAGLPALTDDELVRLEAIEQGKEKPRQGALAVITAERLRRAEQGTPGGLGEQTGEPGAGGESTAEGGGQQGDGGAGEG